MKKPLHEAGVAGCLPLVQRKAGILSGNQAENEEPQPQEVVAFGFLITN